MTNPMQLDHIVINVQRDLDGGEAAFVDLGFHLTPRGYHTLGSMNALAMFGTDYLELLGFPADGEIARPELAAAPMGFNGLVFKSDNVDETFEHLQAVGVAGDPPKSFSRPVTLSNGETHDAKFRTVAVRGDAFPAGRFYFCEHLTTKLVWRPEWQNHANGAVRFEDMTVVAGDATGTADLIAKIIGAEAQTGADAITVAAADGFALLVQTPDQYAAKFGSAARDTRGRAAMIGAVTIKGAMPAELKARLDGDDRFSVSTAGSAERIVVNGYNSVLSFRA